MVGAGAKVLGPFKVGNNVRIAAGAVVLDEVPDNCTAVGVPARVVKKGIKRDGEDKLDWVHVPDPIALEICKLQMQIDNLAKQIKSEETK